MEQPPIVQAEVPAERKVGLGRIGLYLSLAPLVAAATMWLCKPG